MAVKQLAKQFAKKTIKRAIVKKFGTPAEMIAGAALVTAAVVGISEYEKNHPECAYYEVNGKGKISKDFKIAFLSDLHEKEFGEGNEVLLNMIDEVSPDAILIGGDMVVGLNASSKHKSRTKVTLNLCSKLAEKYPVYYANGNHETRMESEDFVKKLKDCGVKYLSDSSESIDDEIIIYGLNLDREQYMPVAPPAPKPEILEEKLERFDRSRYNILLAHSPLFLNSYAKLGADLVLSGHFHGGTIRINKKVGLMTPQYQFFSNKVVGMHQKDDTSMVISPGLGTHSVNIRINDKPQVIVVDIKK